LPAAFGQADAPCSMGAGENVPLVMVTRRLTPASLSRRPRESGGPGLQPPDPPLWMPASAGMTVRRRGRQMLGSHQQQYP